MHFGNYGLPNTWFDKSRKSPVSEYRPRAKMLNGLKDC